MGMLDAWNDHPVVEATLEEASEALGQDVGQLIHEGPKETLALTTNTQPVMLVAAVAAYLPISMAEFSAALKVALAPVLLRLDAIDGRLDKIDKRLDKIDGRLDKIDGRLDRIEGHLDRIEGRLDRIVGSLNTPEASVVRLDAARANEDVGAHLTPLPFMHEGLP